MVYNLLLADALPADKINGRHCINGGQFKVIGMDRR